MDAAEPLSRSVPDRGSSRENGITRAFRFSVRQILLSLILLFIARPFLEAPQGRIIETILFSFILLSSLMAVGARGRELFLSLILILPALTFRWLSHFFPLPRRDLMPLICLALAFGFTIWQLLRFVGRARRVNLDILCAGISVYLLLGQIWALFYLLVDRSVPGSFLFPGLSGHPKTLGPDDAVYFSMCTITTAGYGDVIPASAHARSLATLESTTGVLYVAVLISRLVTLHLADQVAPRTPTQG